MKNMDYADAVAWCDAEAERATGFRVDRFRAVSRLLARYHAAAVEHGLICEWCGCIEPMHDVDCRIVAAVLEYVASGRR
jgi:hypothetical protein